MLRLRSTFPGPFSLRRAARVLGCPPTIASVLRAAQAPFRAEGPLLTGDGVALGGHFNVSLLPDRNFTYHGNIRATGFPSYSASVVTTITLPALSAEGPLPAVPEQVIVFAASGRAHGFNEPGDRQYPWNQASQLAYFPVEWWRLAKARHHVFLDYDADWLGAAGGIINLLVQVTLAGAIAGAAGAAVVVAGTAADLMNTEELVLPGMVGLAVAGGVVYVLGPGVFMPAFIAGAAATAAAVKQRKLSDREYELARRVFHETLPRDRIVLTNLEGLGGREFATPVPGGGILVNLGANYDDPLNTTEKSYPVPGQLLIHELTHAWQMANHTFTPGLYCRAVWTQVTEDNAYAFPMYDGRPWGDYGTEQQAAIVDRWFAGRTWDNQEIQVRSEDERVNPFFRYIRDNIRTGIT